MRHKKFLAIGSAVLLTSGLLVSSSNAAAVPAGAPHAIGATSTTITLITGDRVTLVQRPGTKPTFTVDPAHRRGNAKFVHRVENTKDASDITVIPADALPLIRSGRLDRRLFNISLLVRDGYADTPDALPLIVTHDGPAPAMASRALASINGSALVAENLRSGDFWRSITNQKTGVGKVWLDGRPKPLLDQSTAQVGAPAAWQAGVTGKGVTIAVLDTGYDPTHPDLTGVVEAKNFFHDPSGTKDDHGHGTHVASTMAGTGKASGGKYKGIAPDAKILVGKVCGRFYCTDSAILAGMEWAASKGATAVNMSLGGDETDGTDPMSMALNRLTAQTGTLFVVAAGNSGPQSIGSPGSADAALTVGAVTKTDELASFSSTGPRISDKAIKPDLVAPGVAIGAARAAGTAMGAVVDEHHTRASGTSMATPHVTGAVALLAQQHPDWTAAQFKSALTGSTKRLPNRTVFEQGAGRLDVARATSTPVTTEGELSFGVFEWLNEKPATRTVRYNNGSAKPVTLDLRLDTGAPAGLFTLSAKQITVPAGGSAEVAVTAHLQREHVGLHNGWLVASSGDLLVQTAVASYVEPESYNLSVQMTDRAGEIIAPVEAYLADVEDPVNLATGETPRWRRYDSTSGTYTMRLRKGDHTLQAYAFSNEADDFHFDRPKVTINGDTKIVLDGRATVPVSASVPRKSAITMFSVIGTEQTIAGKQIIQAVGHYVYGTEPLRDIYTTPTGQVTDRPFRFHHRRTMTELTAAPGYPDNKPTDYSYNLLFTEPGGIPADLHYDVRDQDLAKVRTTYRTQRTDPQAPYGQQTNHAVVGDWWISDSPVVVPADGTSTTHYFSARKDLRWATSYSILNGPDEWAPIEDFHQGARYERTWGSAAVTPLGGAFRVGNTLYFASSPYSPAEYRHVRDAWREEAKMTNTLSLDGKVIGTADGEYATFTGLPAEQGRYSLNAKSSRGDAPWSVLATSTDTTWSFDSATAAEARMPLLAVRASGGVDNFGQAPAGLFALNLRAEYPVIETRPMLKDIALQVSFDDGTTWQPVRTFGHGDRFVALVDNKGRFASLKFSATDQDGNTVEQTTIRAYAIRK